MDFESKGIHMNSKTKLKGILILFACSFIWGSSFVAQSVGNESVQMFTFNGLRTVLGALVLLPVILFIDLFGMKRGNKTKELIKKENKNALIYGSMLGVVLCLASNLQQAAFEYTTSGKIAFITALYMFFVPIIGLFIKKRVPLITWICVVVGFIGLVILCLNPEDMTAINKGDFLAFLCAIVYAVQILMVENFVSKTDGVKLSCMQFATSGVITCILMFIFESPQIPSIINAGVPILYAGVLSCGVAYTFQIIGQKYTEATIASLIMCLESVFGVLCAAVVLLEIPKPHEIIGCIIMFAAIIISQLADKIPLFTKK